MRVTERDRNRVGRKRAKLKYLMSIYIEKQIRNSAMCRNFIFYFVVDLATVNVDNTGRRRVLDVVLKGFS